MVPSTMNRDSAGVAIIGAGVSGLAAAWRLSKAGIPSAIFEKSRGLSGRAATRRKNGHHYDHGANFFRLDDPVVARLIQHELPSDDLAEIPGDVHTFDASGIITPGDPAQNAVPKWTYRDGISSLGKQLLQASPLAEVVRETRITRIESTDGIWRTIDQNGNHRGPWKQLLITIPPPQAVDLLRDSDIVADLLKWLGKISYHSQFSFILGYDRPPLADRGFHALVNADGAHPIAWLSFEEDKPGHIANGASAIVAQMSPDWTHRHYETPPESLLPEVVRLASALLQMDLHPPDWWDSQRWRYAHPVRDSPSIPSNLPPSCPDGLHFAGDGWVGKGRVPLAIKTGLDAAERIIALA